MCNCIHCHATCVLVEHIMRLENRTCWLSLPFVLQLHSRLLWRCGRRHLKGGHYGTSSLVEQVFFLHFLMTTSDSHLGKFSPLQKTRTVSLFHRARQHYLKSDSRSHEPGALRWHWLRMAIHSRPSEGTSAWGWGDGWCHHRDFRLVKLSQEYCLP